MRKQLPTKTWEPGLFPESRDCFQRAKARWQIKPQSRTSWSQAATPGGDKGSTTALLERGAQNHQAGPGKAAIHGKGVSDSQ